MMAFEAEKFMRQAIEVAQRGWYTSAPNPRVGCLLVKDNQVIGQGWHQIAGQPHAEVRAMVDAKSQGHGLAGASAYVTLEPCSHYGKTPPCADALIKAGIEEVFVGAQDPNPEVDGQGLAKLTAAGIRVHTGILTDECEALNLGFNQRMRSGRPRVRVKLAASLDGKTAAANGQSQWITGVKAREDVHKLRAESGAVLVGSGTALADNPALNVRLEGQWPEPMRVVLDRYLRLPQDAKMLELGGRTRIYTRKDASEAHAQTLIKAGAEVVSVSEDQAGLDLAAVLEDLGKQKINDVLVEAGPTLAGAFALGGWADEFIIYLAPQLIGDRGQNLIYLPGVNRLDQRIELKVSALAQVGDDIKITAKVAR